MKMGSRFKQMYDAAASTLFRGRDAVAITATTAAAGAAVALDKLQGFWTDGNELADQTLPVIVNVVAVDATTGDETYNLDVVTNNGIKVGHATVKGVGQYVIFIDGNTLHLSDPVATSIQIDATLAGTTPSLTFAAWLGEYASAL